MGSSVVLAGAVLRASPSTLTGTGTPTPEPSATASTDTLTALLVGGA